MEKHYDDGTEPTILPHMKCCNGPCDQGRKQCPTPDACELEEFDGTEVRFMLLVLCAVALMVALLVAFA